jgi:hypothetical protein
MAALHPTHPLRCPGDNFAVSPASSAHQVEWLWTWSGKCFGYRNQDALYSYQGRQVGRFAEGDEIYGHDGSYLGEIRTAGRLITNLSKKKWRRPGFSPMIATAFEQKPDTIAKNIPDGFTDFPAPTEGVGEKNGK